MGLVVPLLDALRRGYDVGDGARDVSQHDRHAASDRRGKKQQSGALPARRAAEPPSPPGEPDRKPGQPEERDEDVPASPVDESCAPTGSIVRAAAGWPRFFRGPPGRWYLLARMGPTRGRSA